MPPLRYFIGWDVGGWNCDKNRLSRDALVILDNQQKIVGTPWRGNLSRHICEASTSAAWIAGIFKRCATPPPARSAQIVMAIDAPLGLPQALVALASASCFAEPGDISGANHYLFRQTERDLFELGFTPLSAIKDMIGSQTTKAMHAVAAFTPVRKSCGVWSDGNSLTVIETYPAAARRSQNLRENAEAMGPFSYQDKADAVVCALVACQFAEKCGTLMLPPTGTPLGEGWIWLPQDALGEKASCRLGQKKE